MTLLLLLAACGRSPAPSDELEGNADGAESMTVVPTAEFARHGAITLRHYFYDGDADSYGAVGSGLWATRRPHGYTRLGGDCDDTDATVNPGAVEVEADGLDNDCDGVTDEATADTGDTAGSDTATDSGAADTDTASTGTDTADSGTDSGTDTGDTAVASTGILVSRDTSGGLTYPGVIYAWYGASTSASLEVSSASGVLNFAPSDADLSAHSWVDIQAAWGSGASWSDDCTGFTVTSSDYTVALYEHTVGGSSGDTCRIYVGLAVPTGSDVGAWTAVP